MQIGGDVNVPNEKEALALMKRHGDPVDVKNRYGWVYQFSVEGIQELMRDWIGRQGRRAASLNRKRQIQPDLFERGE